MRYPILFFPLLLAGVGCVSHEQLVNFNQGPEFPAAGQAIAPVPEPLIQPFDALALSINALDAEAVAPFNLPATNPTGALAPTGSGPAQAGANYQVDAQGNIELPLVGTFHIGGLTVAQARDSIAAVLTRYVKNPFITLRRFAQFRFTVLGEVKTPTTFTLTEDRVTILQAIGMAGDLTNYGDREHILVVREQNGQRLYGHVNLRDRNVFLSPYFYLQRDDVLYVQPLKQKAATVADQTTKLAPFISLGIGVLNLVAIIVTRR